jgi:CheY-like chemotaxis protein
MPAQNITVLLVEDNPMVLAMLRDALSPLAHLTTASDAADALVKAIEHPPDLIVCDYSLPGMDGAQVAERLKSQAGTAKIPFILLASKRDSEKLPNIDKLAEDIIEKPFFVREAVARIRRIMDKISIDVMQRDTQPGKTICGSLTQMSVIDLIQSLELGRKTCALKLRSGPEGATIFLADGEITHAVCGKHTGDQAVYDTLTWPAGEFEIDFEMRASERSTTMSTQALLMEGLRLVDEANRDQGGAVEK